MMLELRRVTLMAAMLALTLLPLPASGAIGPVATGMTGSATDATTAFYSPAGLTRLEQPELVMQTMLAYTSAKFRIDSATTPGGSAEKEHSLLVVPGLFYSRPLRDRISMGLSFNAAGGIGNDYGGGWSGRYISENASLALVAASSAVAFQVTDGLSLAVGPYAIFVDSESRVRVNNVAPGAAEGSVELEESGVDVGYTLGAMYQFTDAVRMGLVYRSELKPDLDGTPTFDNVNPVLREALAALNLLGTEIDVDFKVPQQVQLGFYTEFADRWSMTGDLMWIDMSEFGVTQITIESDSISVEGSFKDMVMANVGLKYRLGKDRAISVGAMYAESPVDDSERTLTLPFDRVIGAGVGYEMPFHDSLFRFNVNVMDLGDGDVSHTGGPLTGSLEGSFSQNYAVVLDFQFTKRF